MNTADILGVQVNLIRLPQVMERIQQVIVRDRRAIFTHANMHAIIIASEQEWFRQFLNDADLTTCDGMGVKLGARLLGYDIPERFTLADWIWQLAGFAEDQGYSLFLLGNPPGVPDRAFAQLQARYPRLQLAGVQHGYFNHTAGHPENEAVIQKINAAHPDILLVGFGMPEQERWLQANWPRLKANITLTCGALFEYMASDLKRGPHWMTDHYLEWLARALISPRRYLPRYLHDTPLFLWQLLKQRFASGARKLPINVK